LHGIQDAEQVVDEGPECHRQRTSGDKPHRGTMRSTCGLNERRCENVSAQCAEKRFGDITYK